MQNVKLIAILALIFVLAGGGVLLAKHSLRTNSAQFQLSPTPQDSLYLYQSLNQPFKISLGDRQEEKKPKVKFEQDGSSAEFFLDYLPSDEVQLEKQNEKSLVYKNVWPGIDIKYSLTEKGVKEEIRLINHQSSISNQQFKFILFLKNVVPRKSIESQATTYFMDTVNGQYRFHIPQPFMIDSADKRSEAVGLKIEPHSTLDTSGASDFYTVTLTPDRSWLNDPARVYPVIIDPTIIHDAEAEFMGTENTDYDKAILETKQAAEALTSPTPEPPLNTITTEEHFSVPSGVIFAWPSTVASIPSGWTRVVTLDSKYLQGTAAGVNPGATGGATTHTHTSPSHNHTQNSHTHSVSVTTATQTYRDSGAVTVARGAHQHSADVSSVTATNNGTAATVAAASSDPLYYDVIWIQSDGTTDIPNGAVSFFNSVTPPSGWGKCDGGDSRPNMLGRFLRGAATGVDGGGTGGAATHVHTSSHTHTQNSHTHTVGSLAASTNSVTVYAGFGDYGAAANGHTHTGSGTSGATTATNSTDDGNIASANGEPPYRYLGPIQNTSGAGSTPGGVIGVWTGTLASIPSGWALCDGTGGTPDLRAYFVKSINVDGDLGSTGGAQGHSHSATSHNHTQASHAHGAAYTSGAGSTATYIHSGSGYDYPTVASSHTHSVSLAGTTATNNAATLTVDTNSDTRPPFYAVAFIMETINGPSGCLIDDGDQPGQLTVKWNDSTTVETGYRIERNVDSGGFVFFVNKSANSTSHLDNTTSANHTYQYRIRAESGGVNSGWCTTATVNLAIGNFKFEGLKLEGLKIN